MTVIAKCLPPDNPAAAAALALAQRGLSVFPCSANKKTPIMTGGFKQASTNPETITAWWENWTAANIAVATGAVSGVVVLDVDVKHDKDGEAALAALERKNGPLPATVEAITPSKGRHLWFQHPGRPVPCSVGALAPGLDIRADGGYVLVCPSYVIEPEYRGAYAWSVDSASEFAPMPEWLLDAAAPTRRAPHPPEYFSDIADGVSEGARNVSLASLTGKLFRVGLKPSQVFEYLLYWNTLNQPPLPEERIKLAVRNIWFRERDRRGGS